jgi:hypothetical protein
MIRAHHERVLALLSDHQPHPKNELLAAVDFKASAVGNTLSHLRHVYGHNIAYDWSTASYRLIKPAQIEISDKELMDAAVAASKEIGDPRPVMKLRDQYVPAGAMLTINNIPQEKRAAFLADLKTTVAKLLLEKQAKETLLRHGNWAVTKDGLKIRDDLIPTARLSKSFFDGGDRFYSVPLAAAEAGNFGDEEFLAFAAALAVLCGTDALDKTLEEARRRQSKSPAFREEFARQKARLFPGKTNEALNLAEYKRVEEIVDAVLAATGRAA